MRNDLSGVQTVPPDLVFHPDGSISEQPAFHAGLADRRADRAARIPVGQIKGPVLLISGGDDQLWPSDTYADQIMNELRRDPSPHVHLNYPGVGHVVLDIPYGPVLTEASEGRTLLDLGGTPSANEAALQHDWPNTISFIHAH